MDMNTVITTLRNEMKPSMGCTEPVAIGLAVSRTCEHLEKPVKGLEMIISSNIFKNAYSVQIPNTGSCGIALSCVLGCLLAKKGNTMEIFADIKPEHVAEAKKLVEEGFAKVEVLRSSQFYIDCKATDGESTVHTITQDSHENLVFTEKDGVVLLDRRNAEEAADEKGGFDVTQYTVADFLKWADEVDTKELGFIQDAIDMNLSIAELGMEKKYAIGVGPAMKKIIAGGHVRDDMVTKVKYTTAAACDFRMSGGNGSVMTYMGSGNQGIATTIPTAVAAMHLGISGDKLLRAEFLGMLVVMYFKRHVGRLSPVCGATLAAAGSAAGITYLLGGNLSQIRGSVQNMMGGVAGIFCDGAKGGCSLKLAICAGEAVYSALFAMEDSMIQPTDGFISTAVEDGKEPCRAFPERHGKC